MKKNFLMVAALLIAAMLMVVSCTQEVAPKNELVEAKLVANFGRDLKVDGDTNIENLSLQYKMTKNWNNLNPDEDDLYEDIVGEKDWTNLDATGFVGWVTPGLWTIEVRAIASGETSEVFKGTVDAYFSQSQKTAVVYLEPEKASEDNKIDITVSMQDIKVGESEVPYKLQYEILKGSTTATPVVTMTDMDGKAKTGYTNVTEYKANKTGLKAGFYTVVVYVLNENNEVVGGIRKGFLLANNVTATITGHIEPADYADVAIETVYVDVDIELSGATVTSGTTADNKKKAIVSFTLKDKTSVASTPADIDEFEKTYVFMVNGEVKNQTTKPTSEGVSYSFDFSTPGYKTIAVQAIYTSTGNNTVFFTETESIVVYVSPDNFK